MIDRQQLLAAVTTIVNVVGSRATDPIGLQCDNDMFTVQAWHSNKQRYGRVQFPVAGVRPFSGMLPAEKLRQLLSGIETQQVDVSASTVGDSLVLKTTNGRFKLAMTGEFADMAPLPELDPVAQFSMSSRDLVRSLGCALPMCNGESVRYAYDGVHIAIGERVVFQGTDGSRLLSSARDPISRSGDRIARVVPRELVRALVTALKPEKAATVHVRMTENATQFSTDTLLLGAANVAGRYPNTEDILRASKEGFVQEIAIGNVLHMARLASTILSAEETGMVVTVNDEAMVAEVTVPTALCRLEITDGSRKQSLKTRLDVKMLRECLSIFDPNETMQWYQKTGDDAAFFHLPDGIIYVQMPMSEGNASGQ